MISKNFFVKLVKIIGCELEFANQLANAVGSGEIALDGYIGDTEQALITEIQDYLDDDVGNSGIDVGEIYSVWMSNLKRPNGYLVKIDDDEYNPVSAGELYNLFEILKERFATAKNIDYATTM